MAILSWNLLEKPFLRLKRFFDGSAIPQNPKTDEMVKGDLPVRGSQGD
jgi:hypothetical protein